MKLHRHGIAIPLVVCCLVVACILVSLVLQRSSSESRVATKMFDTKMAFLAAEAGLNKAASLLISRPLYQRWYLREAGQLAKSDKLGGIRYLMQPHGLPAGVSRTYLDNGAFDVVVVERHKKFPDEIAPKDPVADGFDPRKVSDEAVTGEVLENRLTNAKLSHIDIFSRGEYLDPATKQKSRCLLYGKFVVVPEPYAFEYDSNDDGKVSYYGAGTGEQPVTPDNITHFQQLGNDYMNHPFLDPAHWKKYSAPDLLSQKPIIARVIKVRALYDKDLADADLSKFETLNKIKARLAEENLKFLANFAKNRDIVQNFRREEFDKAFSSAAEVTTQDELQGFLNAANQGTGGASAPDFKNLTDRERNEFIAFAVKNFRYDEEGQVYHDLEFTIAENPLGSLDSDKSKTLGQIFNLSSMNLDQALVKALKEGKITNGEELLKGMSEQAKPVKPDGMSTAEYIKRLSAAIQEYAVVTYPIGKVNARHYTADGIHQPPNASLTEWYEYEIGTEFEEALRGGTVSDPNGFYNQMSAEVQAVKNLPTVAGGNTRPTADLSPKPPEKAENNIPVLLVNKKDVRLTTKFSNILAFYFKYIDFEVGTGKEDYLTADPGEIYIDPGYASRWKCKCLTASVHAAAADNNAAPSASHSAVAVGN